MSEALRCPTCRAPWRGMTVCSRCGSELTALMRVAVKAWELREAARAALRAGDHPTQALQLAQAACRLHRTRRGERLLALALMAAGQVVTGRDLIARLLVEPVTDRSGREEP